MTLPISRTVNVTVSRTAAPPSRTGFGTQLVLTTQERAGILDADNLTRAYGDITEVAADWDSTDEFFKAAQAAFSQNPRPIQIKAGFLPSATTLADHVDAILERDNDWYWFTIESTLRDTAEVDNLITWAESQRKYFVADSNDVGHEDANNTTNVSARHKGTVERTSVFYHNDASEYTAAAAAARFGTFNFDDADSAYTAKFKSLQAVSTVDVGSNAVQAITGFIPQIGQSVAAGHCANTYVNIGGQNFIVEGSTLTPNVFIDTIHAQDWLIARTEELMLSILTSNDRVGMTDQGMQVLASGAREATQIARRAGLIADDLNPETGAFEPSIVITVPSIFDVPESQRQARIAPAIQVDVRFQGAVHYTTINYNVRF